MRLNDTVHHIIMIGCDQLGNITNLFNENDGKANHNGSVATRCGQHGGKNNQSDCHF